MMGLTWDPTFLRTRTGMIMSLEVVIGLVGGLVGIVFANGFESFIYWSTAIVSGVLLFTHVTNLTQSLESKVPSIARIHLGYLSIWSCMLGIDTVYRFVIWSLISLVTWPLLILFLIDLFFKWRQVRSSGSPPAAEPEAASPASVESGGKF